MTLLDPISSWAARHAARSKVEQALREDLGQPELNAGDTASVQREIEVLKRLRQWEIETGYHDVPVDLPNF